MKNNMVLFVFLFLLASLVASIATNRYFTKSRENLSLQLKVDSLTIQISGLEKANKYLESQRDSMMSELNSALVTIDKKNKHIKYLKSKLYVKADSISTLPNDKSVEFLAEHLSKRNKNRK
jgi:hypothetical protein